MSVCKFGADFYELVCEYLTPNEILANRVITAVSCELFEKRLELDMSPDKFADYMGVSKRRVRRWENCDHDFSLREAAQLCDKLGIAMKIELHRNEDRG